MIASPIPMPNMATTVRACIVAVLALALTFSAQPTADALPAAALTVPDDFARFEISNGELPVLGGVAEEFGVWWDCEGVAFWSGTGEDDANPPVLVLKGSCERGFAMGDETLHVKATAAGCGDWTAQFGNVDNADTRPFDVMMYTTSAAYNPGGCGPILELCFQSEGFWTGDYSAGQWKCVPLGLGSPPGAQPEGSDYYDSAQPGCSLWNPLAPWVTAPVATPVSGGWAWRQTVMFSIPDFPVGAGTGTGGSFGGGTVHPYSYVRVGSGVTMTASPTLVSQQSPGSSGWASTSFVGYSGGWQRVNQVTMTLTGPVHGGSSGSTAADILLRSAGYYLYRDVSAGTFNSGSVGNQFSTRPTATQVFNGTPGYYVAYNDPGLCHFAWGEKIWTGSTLTYANPAGPLVDRTAATPPAPSTPYTPPTVDVVDDCTGSTADVCVETPQPPPGQLPDPDSEECDLSAWDPTTYPQQVECGIARIVQVMVVTQLGILDVLEQILDTMIGLLTPPDDLFPDLWARFEQEWDDSALGEWSDALAAILPDDNADVSCEGPGVGPVELIHDGPAGADSVSVPEMHPFDACGDKATAADMVRTVLAAGVTLGGAWRMWDMLAGSLGAYRGGGRTMSEKEWV